MPHSAITYRPSWPLASFVRNVWYYDGYTQPHALERLMPDGMLSLVINLDEDIVRVYDPCDHSKPDIMRGAVVMGAHQRFFIIDTAEQRHVLGVQFLPGGALPFLRMPADELQGRHVALEDIWGPDARQFRERLLAAPSHHERCRLMERELLERAAGRLEVRREVRFAVHALESQSGNVAGVIEAAGLSARRFTELFRTAVGLTPKAYARVRRFQSTMRALEGTRCPDRADIALACGYFDQSHFNHDFREFSGINPTQYVAIDKRHMNHVPVTPSQGQDFGP